MFHIVPLDPTSPELGSKDWLWIDGPGGERYLLVRNDRETVMPPSVSAALATRSLLADGCRLAS